MPIDRASTPPVVARQLGVDSHKVLRWIASGQLRAVNVGDGSRPRWRIMPDDLQAFLERRAAQPAVKATRRRRKVDAAVTEYF